MYALCLDIGTSSLKGAVISSEGKLVSDGRIYYSKEVVWQQALSELAGKLDTSFFIDAVAVSGSGPSFIPLEKDDSISTPLLLSFGLRRKKNLLCLENLSICPS